VGAYWHLCLAARNKKKKIDQKTYLLLFWVWLGLACFALPTRVKTKAKKVYERRRKS
jgi:hypothetical protein